VSTELPRILKVVGAIAVLAAGLWFGAHARAPRDGPAPDRRFEDLGPIRDPAVAELSGLTRSRKHPDLLWGINDSGNPAALIAIAPGQGIRGQVAVEGVTNTDWEDIAGFEIDGVPYLAIADTGDNFEWRHSAAVILVPEPEPLAETVTPLRVLTFTWSDGPHDVESIAVDVPGDRILLADKGRQPPGLYALPLHGGGRDLHPVRIADFPNLISTPPPRALPIGAHWRGTPTAMSLSDDARRLVVLTYESVSTFERAPDQDWAAALRKPVACVRLPVGGTLESIALSADGTTAVIASEGPDAWFLRWNDVLSH
jgi:hypothetical protein